MSVDVGPLTPYVAPDPPAPEVSDTFDPVQAQAALAAALQHCYTCWQTAEAAMLAAYQAGRERQYASDEVRNEHAPGGTDGAELQSYLEAKAQRRTRLRKAREDMPGKILACREGATALDEALDKLEDCVKQVPSDKREPATKLGATLALVAKLQEACNSKVAHYRNCADDYEKESAYTETKKPGPDRKKMDPVLTPLSEALTRVIDIQLKTLTAKRDVELALGELEAMDKEEFTEPQRPTAEEVSRYMGGVENWCRRNLPAQRKAAKCIYVFRQHLAGLEHALVLLGPCLRKVQYLEQYLHEPEVEALVFGPAEIALSLRRSLRDLGVQAERWRVLPLDNSEPELIVHPDEPDTVEALKDQIKNVCIGVANKSIAHKKWQQTRENKPPEPKEAPVFIRSATFDFQATFGEAHKHLAEIEEARALLDQHQALVEEAFDAYEARKEMVRQSAKLCAKGAYGTERSLKYPMSDELRVWLRVTAKLALIHK